MRTDLVIVFNSPDRPGIVQSITRKVVEVGGNWEESRLVKLRGDFAGLARVSIPVAQVNRLADSLAAMEKDGLNIQVRVAQQALTDDEPRHLRLECNGADHEGIVNRITTFLSDVGINVDELNTSIYPAPTTGTPIFNMTSTISLPGNLDVSVLAARLDTLADELALDITIDGQEVKLLQ